MNFVIFDDNKSENFYPLTLNRAIFDLRCGVLKLRQRIENLLDVEESYLIVADYLHNFYEEKHPDSKINMLPSDEITLINGRVLTQNQNYSLKEKISELRIGERLESNNQIVAAKLKAEEMTICSEMIEKFIIEKTTLKTDNDIFLFEYIWQMIHENGNLITKDFNDIFYLEDNLLQLEMGVTALNPYNIWIGEGASLKPGVVLDATEGPIVIDEGAIVMANSVIIGPVYIGKNTTIKALSKIYPNTSIGPVCKIGGEVEDTIISGYSNKQHEGFLGHSYLGEWINLGADTNNSDLKNNYKNVSVYFYPEKNKIDTNTRFMGTIIGDHSKTAINTSINTGTVIGLGCNIFGGSLVSGFLPCFTWGDNYNHHIYNWNKFIETASLVKLRRNLKIENSEKEVLKHIYQITNNK
ncbi:MAG: putative sugar nucleotidyl transferase [Candidatus Cloacimonetes bacterium]|nr:putative sugar nucleotidyl transferase [Candidatus Cloacimonadota bacterium]